MENNQQNYNDTLNKILLDMLREIYLELGDDNMSVSLAGSLDFDEQQRVAKFNNLLVNNLPKIPSFELTEKLNALSKEILKLPDNYRLKSVQLSVEPGGRINISPTYLNN